MTLFAFQESLILMFQKNYNVHLTGYQAYNYWQVLIDLNPTMEWPK